MSVCEVRWIKTHEVVFDIFILRLHFGFDLIYFTLYCFNRPICGLRLLYCFRFFTLFFFNYEEFPYLFPALVTKDGHRQLQLGQFRVRPSSYSVVSTFWWIIVDVGVILRFIWIGQWSFVFLSIFHYFLQFELFSSFYGVYYEPIPYTHCRVYLPQERSIIINIKWWSRLLHYLSLSRLLLHLLLDSRVILCLSGPLVLIPECDC